MMSRKKKRILAKKTYYFLIFLLFFSGLFFSSDILQAKEEDIPVSVSASVDKKEITIGDKLTYTIKVITKRKDIEVKFPDFIDKLAGFAVKDFGFDEKGFFGKKTYIRWYILDTYSTGEYVIPEAVIEYKAKSEKEWHKIKTNKVKVTVKSLLKSKEGAYDIRDIKGPVSPSSKIAIFVLIILLVISIVALLFGFISKKKRSKEEEKIIKPSADEIAYKALDELKRKDYPRKGLIKEYYIELSDIVRHYLEARFSIRAPEMTTEEFLNAVKDDHRLSSKHTAILSEFLACCDLVKFAKYQPLSKEIEQSFNLAKSLIDQTKL
jgi:hypothetical protein